ncbi:MAG: HPP family protein [Candidatus Omnitrophica bacterium]|nr:HPP family protein [Candidatus Omnitrophota bacterium]
MQKKHGIRWKEFKAHWQNYIFQVLFATISTFFVLLTLKLQQAVIVASIGSTAFIVFAMPKSITAQPKNIIGGYIAGISVGSLCSLVPHMSLLHSMFLYAAAVGLSIFAMVLTDTEHPPASGAALGIAMLGFSLKVVLAAMTSVLILALIHNVFKDYLRDLT